MAYEPNPDRKIRNGKAVVSAKELADFKEQYGEDKSLRDLLNMDKGLQRKLVIPKAMQNLSSENSDSNGPINIPKSMRKLPQNEPDQNIRDKTESLMRTNKIPSYITSIPDSEMKRGGAVKKMSSGGSASSRGDGIAQRGKTKGTMVMCGGGMAKGKR